MSDKLHANAVRAQQAITDAGLDATVKTLDESAHTVAEAAAALEVKEAQIAKSLIFMADGEPVMIVASGDQRIDTKLLSEHMGGKKIKRADADAVRSATGYPIGGVSPAGLPGELTVLVEESLDRFDAVWAAAGTPHAVFCSTYKELLQLTGGTPSNVGMPS